MEDKLIILKKIEKYLKSRHFFRRRVHKLLNSGEKFQKVSELKKLSHGLNNIVYNMSIEFRKKKNIQKRDYILRIYPDNENEFSPNKEYKRLEETKKINIPIPEVYIFEKNTDKIGKRFLIMEKIKGKPIQNTINSFSNEETKKFLSEIAKYLGIIHSVRSKKFDYFFPKEILEKKLHFPEYILMEANESLKAFEELELDKKYNVDTKYLYKWFLGHRPLLKINKYSLIHGDVRPSNIIVYGCKIVGLIDWEMSSYCDPAWDIGWSLFFFKLYKNLKQNRDFFFSEYWEYCEKYNIEARVYFYEFLAALKILTYSKSVQAYQKEKYDKNKDFFQRVSKIFPKYISQITHKD